MEEKGSEGGRFCEILPYSHLKELRSFSGSSSSSREPWLGGWETECSSCSECCALVEQRRLPPPQTLQHPGVSRYRKIQEKELVETRTSEAVYRQASGRRKRKRTTFTPIQLLGLESAFEKTHYLLGKERKHMSAYLNLNETQIKVWFQNRRTKWKRQRNEMYMEGYDD